MPRRRQRAGLTPSRRRQDAPPVEGDAATCRASTYDTVAMRTGRTRLFIAALAVALSMTLATCVLLAIDLYFHHRFDAYASLNWRGYRGPSVGRKRAGERRVVMLGGSTVYGESVFPGETIPACLERRLRMPGAPPKTVVNLGVSGNGAFTFRSTLTDYRSLEP